jgi:diaminopimelate epimerase
MNDAPFIKMHGLGNDFVVVDARARAWSFPPQVIRAIGDRRRGVGFDQLLVIEPSQIADVFMRIYNPDGSESGACGNGTRCVAGLMLNEAEADHISIETLRGRLDARRTALGISVNMGKPLTEPADIPMEPVPDTAEFMLPGFEYLGPAGALSMGNPHIVFFVPDQAALDLAAIGSAIEHHPWFPERVNVSLATIERPGQIRVRVWERGAGATLACGSGACAVLVSARRRGLAGDHADIYLPGGVLTIHQADDDAVWMAGPIATSFSGALSPDLLGAA